MSKDFPFTLAGRTFATQGEQSVEDRKGVNGAAPKRDIP